MIHIPTQIQIISTHPLLNLILHRRSYNWTTWIWRSVAWTSVNLYCTACGNSSDRTSGCIFFDRLMSVSINRITPSKIWGNIQVLKPLLPPVFHNTHIIYSFWSGANCAHTQAFKIIHWQIDNFVTTKSSVSC